jgi:outer membrane protein
LKHQHPILILLLTTLVIPGSQALAQQTPSLSLETALKALPNAPAYKVADLTVQSAQRQLEAAQAGAGFNLTANAAYNTSRTDGIALENLTAQPGSGGTQLSSSSSSVSATAGLTVLPWSPAFDGIRAAERNLERANIDRLEARSQLAAQILKQYFDLKLAGTDLELARNAVKLAKSRLEITNAQLEAGVGTREGVLNAKQGLEASNANERAATNDLELKRRSLSITLGTNITTTELTTKLPDVNLKDNALEAGLPTALKQRGDILKAISQVNDAMDSLESARRDRLVPDIGLNLQYGGVSQNGDAAGARVTGDLNFKTGQVSLTPGFGFGTTSVGSRVSLGANIAIPIIAPNDDAKISSAENQLALAQHNLENVRINAELDVRTQHAAAQAALAQVEVARAGLLSAQEKNANAEKRLTAGLGTVIDRETAKLANAQAERDLEFARINAVSATVRFVASLAPINPMEPLSSLP